MGYEIIKNRFTPTNLKNGLSYWKKDQFELLEDTPKHISANVFGTDEYFAELFFISDNEVDANCTCPNFRTLFCKHVAILYFERFKDVLELKKSRPRKTSTVKKKDTISKNHKEISFIQSLDHSELKELVEKALDSEEIFSDFVANYFLVASPSELYKNYVSHIQKILVKGKRQGFINYSHADIIGVKVISFAEEARGMVDEHLYEDAFAICKAIIDKMIKPLNYTDTSSGIFYQGLDMAIELIDQMASDENVSSKTKKTIFDYLLGRCKHRDLEGWGFCTSFLQILVKTVSQVKERKQLENFIVKTKFSDLHKEDLQICLYSLVKKFDGDEAAKKYAENKIIFPEFRRIVFQEYLDKKEYPKAIRVMLEGVEMNKNLPGIVFEWKNNLLKIAQLEEDQNSIRRFSEELFLLVGFNKGDDFFLTLKNVYKAESWPEKRKELEIKLKGRADWLRELFYKEKDANALIELLLNENQGFYFGGDLLDERFINLLLPVYEKEVLKIILSRVNQYLKVNVNRKKYKRLCELLIILKKKGLNIKSVTNEIKTTYPQRPSLMGALNDYFGV